MPDIRIRHLGKVKSHMTLNGVAHHLGLPADLVELALRQDVIGPSRRRPTFIQVAEDDAEVLKELLLGRGKLPNGEPLPLPSHDHVLRPAPECPPGCVSLEDAADRWGVSLQRIRVALKIGQLRLVEYRDQEFCFVHDLNRRFGAKANG